MIESWLVDTFKLKYPIIMAPMFLVSNEKMLIAAAKSGITGCIPALNYREPDLFEQAMQRLSKECPGAFGVNLITNKSNHYLKDQLSICEKYPPHYIITSLGSPKESIERLRPKGVKIICDVVDAQYARRVDDLGADALIAVNSGAGGHAGPIPTSILIPMLKKVSTLPIISAGGIGTGEGLLSTIALGADGVSIGSPFISCLESDVNNPYKEAVIHYGAGDIALTKKISGSPCTVIKTDYVKKIGLEQNFLESFLNQNKTIKKYVKMLTFYKGMKALEKAAFSATYKSVWCAGPSIEFINKQESVQDFISRIIKEYEKALINLNQRQFK